ncbi:hypothetical protein CDD82_7370 [Ophiocordyceps australis]|uniref:Uncharacterized protein n=1 Tax=Ophiocordyceps australis TaxID=1399860 RepID=A0A2C5ZJ30_9HYPO|nr:hypothetical protein CDD82_7370 [Ophiocordyceps australis]
MEVPGSASSQEHTLCQYNVKVLAWPGPDARRGGEAGAGPAMDEALKQPRHEQGSAHFDNRGQRQTRWRAVPELNESVGKESMGKESMGKESVGKGERPTRYGLGRGSRGSVLRKGSAPLRAAGDSGFVIGTSSESPAYRAPCTSPRGTSGVDWPILRLGTRHTPLPYRGNGSCALSASPQLPRPTTSRRSSVSCIKGRTG